MKTFGGGLFMVSILALNISSRNMVGGITAKEVETGKEIIPVIYISRTGEQKQKTENRTAGERPREGRGIGWDGIYVQ